MEKIDKILQLQEKYKNEKLDLSNMTETEYGNLEKIYNIQIYQLDRQIEQHEKKIKRYKKEILEYRKSTIK